MKQTAVQKITHKPLQIINVYCKISYAYKV
jgi:hypothetical protein